MSIDVWLLVDAIEGVFVIRNRRKVVFYSIFAVIVFGLFSVVAKPVVYIVGLIFLEVASPRKVFFEGSPDKVWENGFEIEVKVDCNRLYERNVYILFDGIPFDREAGEKPKGDFYFEVNEAGEKYVMKSEGQYLRYRYSNHRTFLLFVPVRFPEWPVLGGLNCSAQQVYLKFDGLNFDPQFYEITIKIERIGIDG
ncbi:hypothetical protein [Halomonas sp. MCCC 1A11062]|uniref:hypothetical protein n=1 Tax=Halomonas sp. MCCC 1A11062 TaxID=2733485 RepID=UPI001F367CDF|nr:hypothetical protein [Halomonas sp. MCCC 1A11062]MCE8038497.1 hypothetical protein [Halomonas sp. MCCC 1A11062]